MADDQLDNSNSSNPTINNSTNNTTATNNTSNSTQQQQNQEHDHDLISNNNNNNNATPITSERQSSSSSTPTAPSATEPASTVQNNNNQTQLGALSSSTTSSSSTSSSNQAISQQANTVSTPQSILFSTNKWGVTPIRQDTPWDLPPSPSSNNSIAAVGAPAQLGATSHNLQHHHPHHNSLTSAPTNTSQNNNTSIPAAVASSSSISATPPQPPSNSLFSTNHNLTTINQTPGGAAAVGASAAATHAANVANSLHKSIITPTGNIVGAPGVGSNIQQPPGASIGNGGSSFVGAAAGNAPTGMQQQVDGFARAPGQNLSNLDNTSSATAPKPFSATRNSTWSAFGSPPSNDPSEPEWPKTTSSGISSAAPGTPGVVGGGMAAYAAASAAAAAAAAAGPYLNHQQTTSKSPTGSSQYEQSGIGTWSPIVKVNRPGSKWDGDGPDNGRGDNGRLDDGTAIWGRPAPNKAAGLDWVTDKNAEINTNNDKSRSMVGNNQSYRPQQSSSSTSLLMSSNTSPSSQQQHNRNQQTLKQPLSSHNFDQVQQQSNALSSQVNQPNRALGLSSNVPSTQQLKHMVQQIQLAVQAGHLNPQILNQPLAPVTLQLLYQLLQQIKVLHQLQLQASQQFNKPENHPAAVNVHITKTKQNILNLQNQIAAQQAVYLKQPQGHNISSRQPTMPSLATGGVGTGIGPALPPGISQTSDSFRSGSSISDFHGPSAMVNNFGVDSMGANGLANSLGHMNLSGSGGIHSRFDQPWRAPAAKQQYQSSMAAASTQFGNHNLMNQVPSNIQKSMLNSASGNGASSFANSGMQQGDGFDRAPGQTSSIMDNNMAPKPFGMANRSSTWSAFGSPASNQPEPEWPKTTSSGISGGNSTQPSNAFDLVPEFEPGKPWRGSILMKSVEDDPTMTPGSMARSLAPQRKTIWSDEI